MTQLRIEAFRSLDAVAPHAEAIDALNLASRRPSPFATFAYTEAFVAHDEYARGDEQLLFLMAFEGDRLVGYLPLRKHRERLFGVPWVRVSVLVSHDTDRPHVVARAEDEPRCAAAFYDHLLRRERWSHLELPTQDEASALRTPPSTSPLRFHVRTFPTMPNSTLTLPFASIAEYHATLSHNQRKNDARWGRRLLELGKDLAFVSCTDARARMPLLDLYLDLERRSWKEAARSGIRRDPRRIDFFRARCAPHQPCAFEYDLLVVDDLPICGLVGGAFAGELHAFETAFDQDYEDVAPGRLTNLLVIERAIEAGHRAINYDGNYAYYKSRMGAVVTETESVQIYRVGTVPWLKARGGELLRRVRPPEAKQEPFNPERRRVAEEHEAAERSHEHEPRPPRQEERELARAIFRDLERMGVKLRRLSGAALVRALPFRVRREAA